MMICPTTATKYRHAFDIDQRREKEEVPLNHGERLRVVDADTVQLGVKQGSPYYSRPSSQTLVIHF